MQVNNFVPRLLSLIRLFFKGKKMPSGRKDVKVHVTDWEERDFSEVWLSVA